MSGNADVQGTVNLNLLSKDLDEGLALLREVLTTPPIPGGQGCAPEAADAQSMKQRNDDSSAIEQREAAFLAFGESSRPIAIRPRRRWMPSRRRISRPFIAGGIGRPTSRCRQRRF